MQMKSKNMLIVLVVAVVVAYLYLNNNVQREGFCPAGTVSAQQGGCGGCQKGKKKDGSCK